MEHLPERKDHDEGWRITDRYINNTRLRLRRMEPLAGGEAVLKLGQKEVPSPPDFSRMTITNIYLSPSEYDVFAVLPANELHKTRYSLEDSGRTYGVDVFDGHLAGLILAEVGFETSDQMNEQWRLPPWVLREVETRLATVVACSTLAAVKELLLAWYSQNGRKLPWRETQDPYAILVSEIMLQQTQVERVIPRWERWLERWPTVESLAGASTADVIREWQGLGYNRRAVRLHRAARAVAAGGWPDDLTELPGVGPYTAAAVANFAFGRDVLPVDTNVRRVQERTGEPFDAACAQALFDLGATVCLARVPRCDACPLATRCPSRGSRYEPLRKQGAFAGSFRQRRAVALRAVAAGEQPADGAAVASLARDGLVELRGGVASLPA